MEQWPRLQLWGISTSHKCRPINGFERIHTNSDLANSENKFNREAFRETVSLPREAAGHQKICSIIAHYFKVYQE